MRLSKKEIARRQLEVAIDLWFTHGDVLAIITLAGAAEEILGKLVERHGQDSVMKHLIRLDIELTGGREFQVINEEVNGIRNALKHANNPLEEDVDVSPEGAIAMLARALANYTLISNGELSEGMTRLHNHLCRLYPKSANPIDT